jgi:hypothetical protein
MMKSSLVLLGLGSMALLSGSCLQTVADQQAASKTKTPRAKREAPKQGRAAYEPPAQAVEFPKPTPLSMPQHPGNTGNEYTDRFITHWNALHLPANGYFSPEGIPYHAAETLMVEAPDYGHHTTSEAYSYWMWLEAGYGKVAKDWKPLKAAWESTEAYMIPPPEDQPTTGSYSDSHPAVVAGEQDVPEKYPAPFIASAPVGRDPLAKELKAAYNSPYIYGMHWLLDVDNFYGFGRRGDRVSHPSLINSFQRGPQESVWETVPQPCWEDFQFGGENGYLDLFVKQEGGYARQWKYSTAPDADARAVQAMYWAKKWADEQGNGGAVNDLVGKAAKMGDYMRYALFDKYFKEMGCEDPSCAGGVDYGAAHFLISWYYAWGGSLTKAGGWSWRMGASFSHSGYQNPFAAYVLAKEKAFKPASPNGARDWNTSLGRQVEFYRWLQSAEGGIAGGATNSWRGRYEKHPAGATTFYKMAYDEAPVYADPPSNEWFGFQAWTMDRVAQLYYVTGDEHAKVVLDRWVKWVQANTKMGSDTNWGIPSTLQWTGQPQFNWNEKTQHWNGKDAGFNKTLHVKVKDHSQDVGVAGALARSLLFYAAKSGDTSSARLAKELLDRIWKKYWTPKGIATDEQRLDYKRFGDPVYVPPGWKGTMPSGDTIDEKSTFISLRSQYKKDPDWPKIEAHLKGGPAPHFTYHRFWAQVDVALANLTMGQLYPSGIPSGGKAKAEAAETPAKGKKAGKGKRKK